jgi:hypothetical protein
MRGPAGHVDDPASHANNVDWSGAHEIGSVTELPEGVPAPAA